jgi:hypothetical protein
VRTLAALVTAALALALAAVATAAGRPPAVAFRDCLGPEVRPSELLLACGDGTEWFDVSRWTRWTRRSARAVGISHTRDCTPSCVAGRDRARRAVVLLDRPRPCGGRVLFTRLRIVLGGVSASGSVVPCPRA